jgi:hypothetical protein
MVEMRRVITLSSSPFPLRSPRNREVGGTAAISNNDHVVVVGGDVEVIRQVTVEEWRLKAGIDRIG